MILGLLAPTIVRSVQPRSKGWEIYRISAKLKLVDLKGFLAELRRRRVYSVAAAYAVAGWLLIQVATQVFPFFEIASWVVRLIVVLLLLGFPIVVACAWAFEITPKGIKREEELAQGPARRPRRTGRKLTAGVVVLAAVAAGLLAYRVVRSSAGNEGQTGSGSGEEIPLKSIAVLPFENLSSDKDNAYFADGVQDEILTRLSKIADLKVIARASTLLYQSAPADLPMIARQLGVAHILEGTVQRSGNEVRVNVQLINAANDSHLWAESYDRHLTDIFAVESEVAKAIADQLSAKLTGREEKVIASRPTENSEAYDAYLRGLAYTLKTQNTPGNYLGAQKYLREAVHMDSSFALAWALLSYTDARGYHTRNLQPTADLKEEARRAAETALSLEPTLGEAWVADGYYYYGCLEDYVTAIHSLEQAGKFLPNSSRVPESLAFLTRDQGKWDRSESYYNEAEKLDPRNVSLLTRHAQFYITLRRFPEAQAKLDRILQIMPGDIDALVEKAAIAQAEGDLPRAAGHLASLQPDPGDPTAWETLAYQAILERRPAPIIPRLQAVLATPDPGLGYLNGELRFWLGWAQEVAGDHAAAQATWQQARAELESLVAAQATNASLLQDLALVASGLGDKTAAFAYAERAQKAWPIERDAANGLQPVDILARVAASAGEPDRALAALEKIFSVPCNGGLATGMPLTPALLRLDPMFDSLRSDPRFQKLAAAKP